MDWSLMYSYVNVMFLSIEDTKSQFAVNFQMELLLCA